MKPQLKHPKAVRSEDSGNGFYREYDEYDRMVYSINRWGYFSFCFFDDVLPGRQPNTVPYFVLHKFHRLYNPEFM